MLATSERRALRVQEVVAQALILPTYFGLSAWMRSRGYRILEFGRVRREFEAQMGHERGPWLICANHLTFIDSLVIQWAMAPGWRLFLRRDRFAWNLPDRRNISRTWWLRLLGYIGKCVPVLRQAPPEDTRRTLDKIVWLLSGGQAVVIFPEGGRSRVGRVDLDRVTYGVGRMLQEAPATRVLCVYARGVGQKEHSDYPRSGERFFVRAARLEPATAMGGMRGARELATQIVTKLSEMEAEYLKTRWWVGNDIVDLAEPGVAGKEQDRRFMDRVFTPAERAYILEAAAPTLALWKTWAAKETAFKIAGKLREGLVFAHRAFEVEADAAGQRARVRFEDLEIRVRWELARDYVHCIGHFAKEPRRSPLGTLWGAKAGADSARGAEGGLDWRRLFAGIMHEGQALQGELSHAEQASVHSTASERARLLARRLMERWDLQGAEIVRLWRAWGWGPPVVAREGAPLTAFDVSLSHDGRFVAAAIVGPVL